MRVGYVRVYWWHSKVAMCEWGCPLSGGITFIVYNALSMCYGVRC